MKKLLNLVVISSVLFTSAYLSAEVDISKALKHRGLALDRTSVAIADAESGKLLASYQPDLQLNPASCMKVITSSAALSTLGPDYRFKTDFFADRHPQNGSIGNLYIYGNGDPLLVSESFWRMARGLYDLGIRKIDGDIVIDNSFFDSHDYPRKDGADNRAYTAKTSALSFNFNSVTVSVSPAKSAGQSAIVAIEPPADYFQLVNQVQTGGKYAIDIASKSDGSGETLIVKGQIPASAGQELIYRSVKDPVAYAGSAIKFILEQNGISVVGKTRSGTVPSSAVGLLSEKSDPLSSIIKDMNKFSNNFAAEQILKVLGATRFGKPGSTEKGIRVLKDYLSSVGIDPGRIFLENGSGLSDKTRLSAGELTKVLVASYKDFSIRPEFLSSLSILGVDGTMRKWNFEPALRSQMRAKTGTLDSVSTLAGYVPMANGRIAAFSILANGLPRGAAEAHQAELQIVKAISEARQ